MPTCEGFLSREEVRERLKLCSDDATEDAYMFGQRLADEALERVRNVERKAVSFTAYGTGVLTLLASTFSIWANPGNRHSLWIAFGASICAASCAYFALDVLKLRKGSFASEDDWLNKECLTDIKALKKFRVQTLWEDIDSRFRQQQDQARQLRCAELSLRCSGLFLVCLLFHLAFLQLIGHSIERHHSFWQWKFFLFWPLIGDILTCVFVVGVFLWFYLRVREARSFRFLRHTVGNYKSYEENKCKT